MSDLQRSEDVETSTDGAEFLLVYDKECPVCDNYCRRISVAPSAGRLVRINARESGTVLEEITAAGLDIDQGMVLKIGDLIYYGADAIHVLALISAPSGPFNRLNRWVFRSKSRARLLYPFLRTCRNLLLKILGKTKINNLGIPNNERF